MFTAARIMSRAVLAVAALLALSTAALAETYVTFDPPYLSKFFHVTGLNDSGAVIGYYQHKRTGRSFLRAADGTITPIAVKGAYNVSVMGINNDGAVAGRYETAPFNDPSRVVGGFIRTAKGKVTTFLIDGLEVYPVAINKKGVVAGYALDRAKAQYHGFVRSKDGQIATFDVTSVSGASGTRVQGLNDKGDVVGTFRAGNSAGYGFVRSADGTIATFKFDTTFGVFTAINSVGAVVGYYGATPSDSRGFLRAPDGTITLLSDAQNSLLMSSNNQGTAAGLKSNYTYKGPFHGILRASNGAMTTFSPLGAYTTYSTFINAGGQVAGTYSSSDSKYPHGYIRLP
jgi:hypothetical protein